MNDTSTVARPHGVNGTSSRLSGRGVDPSTTTTRGSARRRRRAGRARRRPPSPAPAPRLRRRTSVKPPVDAPTSTAQQPRRIDVQGRSSAPSSFSAPRPTWAGAWQHVDRDDPGPRGARACRAARLPSGRDRPSRAPGPSRASRPGRGRPADVEPLELRRRATSDQRDRGPEAGQVPRADPRAALAARIERGLAVASAAPRAGTRPSRPKQGGVGRLAERVVLAGGLAQRLGGRGARRGCRPRPGRRARRRRRTASGGPRPRGGALRGWPRSRTHADSSAPVLRTVDPLERGGVRRVVPGRRGRPVLPTHHPGASRAPGGDPHREGAPRGTDVARRHSARISKARASAARLRRGWPIASPKTL